MPGVMTPVPFAKTPVRVVLDPVVMFAALAPKLVIEAVEFTVTVAVAVAGLVPLAPVTVSVYVVVIVGLTVTATPLVAGRLPGVMTPVPFAKTPVRVALPPLKALAAKLLIEGAAGGVVVLDDPPPQAVKPTKPRMRVTAIEA